MAIETHIAPTVLLAQGQLWLDAMTAELAWRYEQREKAEKKAKQEQDKRKRR